LKEKLKNIAGIQTGLFARTVPQGDVGFLQAKHFDFNGLIIGDIHPELIRTESMERHLLQPGDVLFAAKGTRNFATIYEIQNLPCVASTSFFLIRIRNNNILPEYLAWYLNHPITLQLIKSQAIGSSIVSIAKPVLEELEVLIPDSKTQNAVLEISRLRTKEKLLKKQIEDFRDQQIQYLTIKAIK
jgi:restriction endonuclease S subunit